ncbi:DUF4189 domain-containing protein [Aliihoeflea sp. PC F10.4]
MNTVRTALVALGCLLVGPSMAADPVGVPTAPPAIEQSGIWAAIAYSEPKSRYGFFWGADQREEAERSAMDHCENDGGENCEVVSTFRNHRHWDDDDQSGFPYHPCGALAVGEKSATLMTPWSAKSARTRREAEDAALEACEASGGSCKIREWVCT